MSLEKFFNIIDSSFLGRIIAKKQEIIEMTDPERIYIENIRSFFNMPYTLAKGLCELAVKEKVFKKRVGYLCPNEDCDRLLKSFDLSANEQEILTCYQCQLKQKENFEFPLNQLDSIVYYQLRK